MNALRLCTLPLLLLAACTEPRGGGDSGTGSVAAPVAAPLAIGRVAAVEGQGFVWHDGQRIAAATGVALYEGDRLETGANAKMKAALSDESVLAIGADTSIELSQLNLEGGSRTGQLKVAAGKFWMHVRTWTGSGPSLYEIATPNAVAGVRGTTLWGDTKVDAICSLQGTIEVRSLKDASLTPATVTAGNCATELSHGKLTPVSPSAYQIDTFLKSVLIIKTTP